LCIGLNVKYQFLQYFSETWIFSTDFWKILKYKISCKCIWVVPYRRTNRHDKWI